MKASYTIFLIFSVPMFGQNINYNTKKGVAVNGYDVVAYFSGTALAGNKKFATTFEGVKYLFSSEENLNKFVKTPEKYLPQYGGYCAYAIALKNKKVSINPKSFLIHNDKLYLFYNAWGTNTLDLWLKEKQDSLVAIADKNWQENKFNK